MTRPTLRSSPGPARYWLRAVYFPHHPVLATMPVLGAWAVATHEGPTRSHLLLPCMVASILLEIGGRLINYHQDAGSSVDAARFLPADHPLRTGMPPPRHIFLAGCGVLGIFGVLAAAIGWTLAPWGPFLSPPIVFLMFNYAGGPGRLGHRSMGELLRFLAFGTASLATYVILTHKFTATAALLSVAHGCLAVAGMTVQNYRDRNTDREAGKITIAVRLGEGTRAFLISMIALPYGLLVPMALLVGSAWVLCPLVSLPWAARIPRLLAPEVDFYAHPRRTIPVLVAYGGLLTVGFLLA